MGLPWLVGGMPVHSGPWVGLPTFLRLASWGGAGIVHRPTIMGTMEAAPRTILVRPASLLNLLRVSGTSLGVASTSAVLSQPAAGGDFQIPTQGFAGAELLHAAVETLTLLAGFAVPAAAVSLVSRKPFGQALARTERASG